MALKQAASEKEKYEALIERMKSQIRQLEENGMALSTVCRVSRVACRVLCVWARALVCGSQSRLEHCLSWSF